MTADDTPEPQAPRFVPVLTEVVQPGAAPAPATSMAEAGGADAAPAPGAPRSPAADRLVADAVLARLGPGLERLISETVARVLHEQMHGFHGRVQKAVADVVREAVAKDLLQRDSAGLGAGETP